MTDLDKKLQDLGLEQYSTTLRIEGFETWQHLLDITEYDLSATESSWFRFLGRPVNISSETLGVKLGHRRRLQRAIQDDRNHSSQKPLLCRDSKHEDRPVRHPSTRSAQLVNLGVVSDGYMHSAEAPSTSKRKYRRHSKPDRDAPSAYILFSNRFREQVKGQDLSFTEIAKIVGEKWQGTDVQERSFCERLAQELKEDYHNELAAYKQTKDYAYHQVYLTDFKARHGDRKVTDTKKSCANVGLPHIAHHGTRDLIMENDAPCDDEMSSKSSAATMYTQSSGDDDPKAFNAASQPAASPTDSIRKINGRQDGRRASVPSTLNSSRNVLSRAGIQPAWVKSTRPWEISAPRLGRQSSLVTDGATHHTLKEQDRIITHISPLHAVGKIAIRWL